MAMGGAFGALGADFSVLSQNPGGIGLYRKNEFSVSPLFNYRSSNSDYLNTTTVDGRFNFGFSNFGAVFTHRLKNDYGWKNVNFGIGYNRINNFSNRVSYEGINNDNSLLDAYLQEAAFYDPSTIMNDASFETGQAFNIYLIDSINGNQYYSALPHAGELQRKTTRTRGSMGEWGISGGANYGDKLFFGGTFGFTTIRYIEDSRYEEIDIKNSTDSIGGMDFNSFTLDEYLSTVGTGFNFKIGLVYKPADWMRIGAAFHTPTWYSLTDNYSTQLVGYYKSNVLPSDVLMGAYEYSLATPLKAIGSIAFIIGNYALISADYEYMDYSMAHLDSRDYGFNDENKNIGRKYGTASNYRVGGEYRYDIFSFRLGCAYYGTPFQDGLNDKSEDQHQWNYTGGFGIRGKVAFIDFAYALAQSTEFYRPYGLSAEEVPGVVTKTSDSRFVMTVGVRW